MSEPEIARPLGSAVDDFKVKKKRRAFIEEGRPSLT
jgi:hypothetical protein